MTEFEQLKRICEKIEYNDNWIFDRWDYIIEYWKNDFKVINDVREIIFNKNFMDKFLSYIEDKRKDNNTYTEDAFVWLHIGILDSLDNVVDLLYNVCKEYE